MDRPKSGGLEDEFPFQTGDSQVPAVRFWGSNDISGKEIAFRFEVLGITIRYPLEV